MPDRKAPPVHVRRNDRLRAVLLLGLLALLIVAAAIVAYLKPHGTGQRIGVGDVLTLAKDKRVVSATLRDEDALVVGDLKAGRGALPGGGRFSAELPKNGELTASLTALLAATGADVRVDHQNGKDHAHLLLTALLPVLALADLMALVLLTSPHAERLRTSPTGWPGEPATTVADPPAPAVETQPDVATPMQATPERGAPSEEVGGPPSLDAPPARAPSARTPARKATAAKASAPKATAAKATAAKATAAKATAAKATAAKATAAKATAAKATAAKVTAAKAPPVAQPARTVTPRKAAPRRSTALESTDGSAVPRKRTQRPPEDA